MQAAAFRREPACSTASTPTWVTPYRDGYAFTTDPTSFKVRRLTSNPRVVLTASNVRGTVQSGATAHPGRASLLSPAETAVVSALIKKKYRVSYTVLISTGSAWRRLTRRPPGESVGVYVVLDAATS